MLLVFTSRRQGTEKLSRMGPRLSPSGSACFGRRYAPAKGRVSIRKKLSEWVQNITGLHITRPLSGCFSIGSQARASRQSQISKLVALLIPFWYRSTHSRHSMLRAGYPTSMGQDISNPSSPRAAYIVPFEVAFFWWLGVVIRITRYPSMHCMNTHSAIQLCDAEPTVAPCASSRYSSASYFPKQEHKQALADVLGVISIR